jgi:NAD-reducing hydrogenase large subunit
MGQIIQSHGMHFFELAGPDLILGFDADPATRNVVGLIQADPNLSLKAVALRKYGQEIIHTVAGRRIHPNFAVPGGVNKALTAEDRDAMLKGYDEMVGVAQLGLKIFKDWAAANQEDINKFAVFPSGYMGLVTPENGLELYQGDVRLIGKDGKQLELFDSSNYLDVIAEHVEDWSYLKFPYYKKMGYPAGAYRVGPLGV